MTSAALKLSKAEWREVSDIAAQFDWARHEAGNRFAAIEAGLNDRAAAALRQLLRFM